MQTTTAAGWYVDPSGRHEYRYWDGRVWTPAVTDSGVTGIDPLSQPPAHQAAQGAARQATPGKSGSGPTFALLVLVGALISIGVSMGWADKRFTAENPPADVRSVYAAIWIVAGLVLAAAVVVAARSRTAAKRILMVVASVGVLAAAAFSTQRVYGYSSSGFIAETIREHAANEATRASITQAAVAVCLGERVAAAPASSALAPLVIVNERTRGVVAWDQAKRRGWAPQSTRDLQTVVCMRKETRAVGYCSYTNGASYTITSYEQRVDVVEAATGDVREQTVLRGPSPNCAKVITGIGAANHSNEKGGHVTDSQVIGYVAAAAG